MWIKAFLDLKLTTRITITNDNVNAESLKSAYNNSGFYANITDFQSSNPGPDPGAVEAFKEDANTRFFPIKGPQKPKDLILSSEGKLFGCSGSEMKRVEGELASELGKPLE